MGNDREVNNSKKTNIIFQIVIILLLLVALIGLAFALFMKGDEDINVNSGECKVDLVDTEGNTLVGNVLNFVSNEGDEQIYFQPGAAYYTEGFKVENVGTISVNFRISVSNAQNPDKEAFDQAFEFWITKDVSSLEDAEKLTSFKDKLEVDQTSETYYLVAKMKESAGNEFQDKVFTGIVVNVYAIQADVEIE